jgi:glyoxylate reductase
MDSIFITRPIPTHAVDTLRSAGFDVAMREDRHAPSKRDIIHALSKKPYVALVAFLTDTIDEDVFIACPTLRIVSNYAVGFNNIDIVAAKKRGIVVTNTAGTSGAAVAEFTVALMFALATRLVEGDRFVHAKKYKGWDPYLLLGKDIGGKTIGLIGSGDIGSRVGKMMLQGFGCSVLYYDIKPNTSLDALGARFVSQEEVLKNADIVSLHVPLMPSTTHLINKDTIALMKSSALLINTSRGPVIDELALIDALKMRRIAGAALDVYEFEPKISRALRSLPNAILTPHIASARVSVRESMGKSVADTITTFFADGEVTNLAR